MTTKELNELKELIKSNKYMVHGDITAADCIIGFSFGYQLNNKRALPGKSNKQLANYIEKNFLGTPLILQYEIAVALKSAKPALIIKDSRKTGEYLNSREVAEQALEFMKKNNWRKAIIITHPGLEARNDYLCTALGIVTIAPEGLEIVQFDEASEQPWTRSEKVWIKKEVETIDNKNERGWLAKPKL